MEDPLGASGSSQSFICSDSHKVSVCVTEAGSKSVASGQTNLCAETETLELLGFTGTKTSSKVLFTSTVPHKMIREKPLNPIRRRSGEIGSLLTTESLRSRWNKPLDFGQDRNNYVRGFSKDSDADININTLT